VSTPAGTNYEAANNSRYFRDVLGNVPTSVVAVTAMDEDGKPTGMTVGSFTSVSLDPPLVAFMPGKSSSTMPKIQAAGRFCANILTADQEDVCRQLAIKGGDKFARLRWETSPHGTPHIAGAIGWIDCTITGIHDAGDHLIVMGAVESLRADHRASPLIFLRGGYGRFASTSLSAPDEADLYRPLRMVDQAWPAMQAVADDLAVECLASAVIADQLVLVGSSLSESTDSPFHLRLGQRMPFQPPLAMPLIAWRDTGSVDRWIGRGGAGLDQAHLRQMLERVRDRGWSLVLRSPEQVRFERAVADMPLNDATRVHTDEVNAAAAALQLDNYEPHSIDPDGTYSVRLITVPVFDVKGDVHLALSLYQLPRQMSGADVLRYADRLTAAARAVTAAMDRSPVSTAPLTTV
jgi:flavin reductase (DIM6/NTAB) family NADH-FMN oxidoreductase RutF/DNA-binding IclR family transcriptional regulator